MRERGLTEGKRHGLTWLDRFVPAPNEPYKWQDLAAPQPAPVAPAEEELMWELLGNTLLQHPAAHQQLPELHARQEGSLQLTSEVRTSMLLCMQPPCVSA